MGNKTVTLNLPADLYARLQQLASESDTIPTDLIARLVEDAFNRRDWLRDLDELREQIKCEDNRETESDQEEFIEQLRKTRRDIFEAEYAHLYR